jgi:hypothetical protein
VSFVWCFAGAVVKGKKAPLQ